jgi:hypothetical protein
VTTAEGACRDLLTGQIAAIERVASRLEIAESLSGSRLIKALTSSGAPEAGR